MKNIYVFGIIFFISLFISSIAEDKFKDWYKAVSKEGNYQIMFPAAAIYSIYPKMGDGKEGSFYAHELTEMTLGLYFAVQCFHFKNDDTPEERIQHILNSYRDDYTDSTFKFRDSVSHDAFERKGIEYTGIRIIPTQIKRKDIRGYLRIYYRDDKVYTFEVVGDDEVQNSELPETFFNSFELLNKD